MTHEKDSPWYTAWNDQNGKYWNSHPINDALIKSISLANLASNHENLHIPHNDFSKVLQSIVVRGTPRDVADDLTEGEIRRIDYEKKNNRIERKGGGS